MLALNILSVHLPGVLLEFNQLVNAFGFFLLFVPKK